MPFDNSKNQARARNIAELLGHVEKSANANQADPAEIAATLEPALAALGRLGLHLSVQEDSAAPTETLAATPMPVDPMKSLKPGQRAAIILADQASTRELIASLIARLDHQADQLKGWTDGNHSDLRPQ
ncbi:MAG: hypothetical protein AAFR10_16815 [Pseudomonadota bacterium]